MIVIPMAGLSSRFAKAGYDKPKFMLEAHGKTLFFHSVNSFQRYFDKESFLFIALEAEGIKVFIKSECEKLGIDNYSVILLREPTSGQAETVYQGLLNANVNGDEPILIFNIDTFRPDFKLPDIFEVLEIDGYLETFIGEGPNWSNILPAPGDKYKVLLTAEKQEISEFCCTGLYYFSKSSLFKDAYSHYVDSPLEDLDAGERYIAPMYNYLISKGNDIRYSVIPKNEVVFCGVPVEYEDFKNINVSSR